MEAGDLHVARQAVDDLNARVEALERDVAGSKAAEGTALARLQKAVDAKEGLRKEIDAERSSSQALSTQVELLQRRLEEARAAGVAKAELNQAALGGFSGATLPLPSDASALGIFAWFKENITRLPNFIGGAMDIGALSCATNLWKTLGKLGCAHFAELRGQREFVGPSDFGETSGEISKRVRNFMKHFWLKFGLADAHSLAEARHATVSDAHNFLFSITFVLRAFLFTFSVF